MFRHMRPAYPGGMLTGTVLPGNPASVAVELTHAQIAACAHALSAAREARYRLAEMTADDVVTLRGLTAAVDALEADVAHGESATVVLTAARLLLVADAVRDFVTRHGDAEVVRDAYRQHGRAAAELIDPLADLAHRALSSALEELPDGEPLDDDAFDRLLRGG